MRTAKQQQITFSLDAKDYHPTGQYSLIEVNAADESYLLDNRSRISVDIKMPARSVKVYKLISCRNN